MAKINIKSDKITPFEGFFTQARLFSRLLNLNPQWGKGCRVLI